MRSIRNYLGRAAFNDFIGKIKQVENNKKPQKKEDKNINVWIWNDVKNYEYE